MRVIVPSIEPDVMHNNLRRSLMLLLGPMPRTFKPETWVRMCRFTNAPQADSVQSTERVYRRILTQLKGTAHIEVHESVNEPINRRESPAPTSENDAESDPHTPTTQSSGSSAALLDEIMSSQSDGTMSPFASMDDHHSPACEESDDSRSDHADAITDPSLTLTVSLACSDSEADEHDK